MTDSDEALISHAYEAVVDDSLWVDLGRRMAATLDCHSACVQVRAVETGARVLSYTPNIDIHTYEQQYAADDIWVQRAVARGANKVLLCHEFLDERDLVNSAFYSDFARRCDQHFLLGAILDISPTQVGGFGIHRRKADGRFTEKERAKLTNFAAHLQRALRMRARLAEVSTQTKWTLDALAQGNACFFVLDRNCGLVHASPDAASLTGLGQPFAMVGGCLQVRDSGSHRAFAKMVAAAVATAEGTPTVTGNALLLRRPGSLPVSLTVSPLPRLSDNAPCALVFIKDAAKGGANPSHLKTLFGLTETEAQVAAELAGGASLHDIAERHEVSENTVRTHVQRILSKSKTSRQGEFVGLVLRSAAGTVDPVG